MKFSLEIEAHAQLTPIQLMVPEVQQYGISDQ